MTPERWAVLRGVTWFEIEQTEVREYVEGLRATLAALVEEHKRAQVLWSSGAEKFLPRCRWLGCKRIGVKWVARTTLYCDEHGSNYLQDAPWAEAVRALNR